MKISATQIVRIVVAFAAAGNFSGKSAPWARRILDAMLAQIGCDKHSVLKLSGMIDLPDLREMVILGPSRDMYRLDREYAEILAETATDFWLRAACQSAVYALWQDAAREMLEGGEEMAGSSQLTDRILLDVAAIAAMFGGSIYIEAAQDADFQPVLDLEHHLKTVADDLIRYRREAAERREAIKAAERKPAPKPPVPEKKGFWARLFGG